MAKKEKAEKPKWKFFWKNVGPLGMLWRVAAGIAIIIAGRNVKDDSTTSLVMTLAGAFVTLEGLLRWCSLRALLKKPTRRAYLRHYPETTAD